MIGKKTYKLEDIEYELALGIDDCPPEVLMVRRSTSIAQAFADGMEKGKKELFMQFNLPKDFFRGRDDAK